MEERQPFHKGKLIARSGELITEFPMLPFQLMPEVAVWGTRVFVLDDPFKQTFGNPAEPIYREACMWSLDASKAMEEMNKTKAALNATEEYPKRVKKFSLGSSLGSIEEK